MTDEPIAHLTELFAALPGLGPRSASRVVTELLTKKTDLAEELAKSLTQTLSRVHRCARCNTLTTETLCPICARDNRDRTVICVVEMPSDMLAIEESVAYDGGYFVLMGRVNPLHGVGPTELGIERLIERVQREGVQEVVLATSFTAEGETTAHMLAGLLKKHVPGLRVTRLARGLPSGIEVEYTDPATIASAVLGRA